MPLSSAGEHRASSGAPAAHAVVCLRERAQIANFAPMPIRTKRWNEEAERDDGTRVLVCRYRPRGVKRSEETWHEWCQAVAPSRALLAAYYGKSGAPISWSEFERRFREEMKEQTTVLAAFAARLREGETLTLLCSSACTDPARCHRTILKELLARRRWAQSEPA
jgi:uncharacterized protein YeaO (DUF488 family)